MREYSYINNKGVFSLEDPELTSYLYFPIANESGVMSSVTPTLSGDSKMGQNTFLLAPVSSEDLHNNKSSRNFWCNFDGGGYWSATGMSSWQEALLFTDKKEPTQLEAGFMWHKVTRVSKKFGITSEILSFVPHTKDTLEIMMVTLSNNGPDQTRFAPTVAISLYGRSADNIRDHRNVTSLLHRAETREYGVILNPTLTFDERGHQKNTVVYGVFGAREDGKAPIGFYPSAEEFIGEGGSFENPKAIIDQSVNPVGVNYKLDGYETLGGLLFDRVTLKAEEKKTYIIVLGYGSSVEDLEIAAMKYKTKKECLKAFTETKEYWENKVNVAYNSGSKNFDSWMQWVNFQPMLRRIYGCSFLPHHDYGRGGRGWRDLWQDCLALLIMNPSGVRDMLISNFAGVRIDGTNATIIGSNQGEFIADRNNITRVWMDHGVWPFLTTRLYIMQSGDIDILLKKNYYFKDPQAARGEEKDSMWKPSQGNCVRTASDHEYQGSILEHMLLEHLTQFYDVGEHNHMRLRGADWNDALDMAKERGESVAFTAIYGSNLQEMASLLLTLNERGTKEVSLFKEMEILLADDEELFNDIGRKQSLLRLYSDSCRHKISGEVITVSSKKLASNLMRKADWIKKHIRDSEWITNKEGHSWYNGYYDNKGRKVEGDSEIGVRMMLTGQVFTIMSETATKEQVESIVAAADEYLYDESLGGYKLNTNFKELKDDLGRMFGFAYGHKENGAVFSHMTVMYANALYQRGFVKEGFKVIDSLYRHCSNFEKSRIYPGIPEYIGDNGRGLYHYLTGSASWLMLTVLTEMFGIKGEMGDLRLEPKLMLEQFDKDHKACVELIFAERKLNIRYSNKYGKEYGSYKVDSILIDGKAYNLEDTCGLIYRKDILALSDDKEHVLEVELA